MLDPEVIGLADEVIESGLTMAHDMDAVVGMVRERASRYEEPRASWFMADVLDAINEREMALEG